MRCGNFCGKLVERLAYETAQFPYTLIYALMNCGQTFHAGTRGTFYVYSSNNFRGSYLDCAGIL